MQYKKIIDITRRVYKGVAVYPGDSEFNIYKMKSMNNTDSYNLSTIEMSAHTGTHIDAPYHFIKDGKSIEQLDLSKFIGNVKIFKLDVLESIRYKDIKDLPIQKEDIVFFKTSNSYIQEDKPFVTDYIYLHEDAANYLVEKQIKTVGIDYFSVDGYAKHVFSHKILLSREIGIIEGLYLNEAEEGMYFLSCLPLKLEGSDGSPVRAVLLEL